MINPASLQRFLDNDSADNQLAELIHSLSHAAASISQKLGRAGLGNLVGATEAQNVYGEEVQKLDVFSNDLILEAAGSSGVCHAVASEENERPVVVGKPEAPYLLAIDPLDGSSNIDVNISVGTIFSVYRNDPAAANGFLQGGRKQIAAGYFIYGTSVMLVLSTGRGVHGFTLDVESGNFRLSHEDIRIPESGKLLSVNYGLFNNLFEGVKRYIAYGVELEKPDRPYTFRYIGSMVADFHRNLLKGGIFIYPASEDATKGKLRLLFECYPMSMIAEQAGGMATDGNVAMLDVKPEELHQRTPIFVGSKRMVEKAMEFQAGKVA